MTVRTVNNIQAILILLTIVLGLLATASVDHDITIALIIMPILVIILAFTAWLEQTTKKY